MSTTGENSEPNPISIENVMNSQNQERNESLEPEDIYDESKLSSQVWDHFKKAKIDGKWKAICNYCSKPLASEPKSGTSHLKSHSEVCRKRPRPFDIRQSLLRASVRKTDGKCMITSCSFNQEDARKKLRDMIILHEYPLSIVDHEGFKEYSLTLQPLFKVPSRNTIRSDILKFHNEKKLETMSILEAIKGRIAITTDMWTAEHQTKGYMAITAHFIDDSWVLQQRVLR